MNGTSSKDQHIAEVLFEKHKNTMYHIAFSVLRNKWEAEDAVMDAMVKICINIVRFQNISEIETKLLVFRYTENAALDRARRNKHTGSYENSNLDESCDASQGESKSAENEYFDGLVRSCYSFGELSEVVNRLDIKYREILCLRYGEEWTNQEIANMLGIPISTVSTRISRAKLKIKSILEEIKHEK